LFTQTLFLSKQSANYFGGNNADGMGVDASADFNDGSEIALKAGIERRNVFLKNGSS
jgi:hypothetical protein